MKKILTLALVGAMLTATGITAYAVPGNTTEVSYEVAPTYTVVIPESVALGDTAVTADIEATNVLLEDGKQIKVDLTAASNTASGSTFNAKNGDSAVTYTISAGDKTIAVNDTVATFTANGSKTLTFSAADKSAATVAGSHTETLTFGIAVEDAVATPTLADAFISGNTTKISIPSDFGNTTVNIYNNSGAFSVTGITGGSGIIDSATISSTADTFVITLYNSGWGIDDDHSVLTFNKANNTYSVWDSDYFGVRTINSVTINDTDITNQLTKN